MFPENYTSLQLTVTAFILGITCMIVAFIRYNRSLPPGPWGLPIFGYYPFISPKFHLDFVKLSKQYGDVFSLRSAGGKLFIILNGPKAIKEVLVNRSEEFIGRPVDNNLLEWISDGLGVTQEEGKPWKEHRRFFIQTSKTFGFGKLRSEGFLHEEMKVLIDELQQTAGQPVDMSIHIAYAVNSVVSQILYSKKFVKYSLLFRNIAEGASRLVEMFGDHRFLLVGPVFQYIAIKLFPGSAARRKGRHVLKSTIQEIINEHVTTFDSNNLRDYIDAYLHQRMILQTNEKTEDHTFTMERLTSISMNMMMEGTESVAATICNLLLELSKYPDAQNKAQIELDSIVGKERMPSWFDRSNLPYLDALIQELYRTGQLFYITTHYSNFKETTIRGYRIPRRSIILGNLWTINNDPIIFPNPSKFDPNRFLDDDGKRIKHEGSAPFGIGKRACAGESLAKLEVFVIIACLLQVFTLHPAEKDGKKITLIPREKE